MPPSMMSLPKPPFRKSSPAPPSRVSSLPAPFTSSPFMRVAAGAALQEVSARVADNRVVEGVAGAIEVRDAHQDQGLEIGAEGVADAAVHRVETPLDTLDHDIFCAVDG